MNALLEQFLSESRDFLQGIGEKLMQLESDPESIPFLTELFRFIHTLKGNSGLFDFPEMTRVLHASEDLMDAVRHGRVHYSQTLTDQLLDAMDFVGILMDEIESTGRIGSSHASSSAKLTKSLRDLLAQASAPVDAPASELHGISNIDHPSVDQVLEEFAAVEVTPETGALPSLDAPHAFDLSEEVAMALFSHASQGTPVFWVTYHPEPDCFFKGEDPFYLVRQVPEVLWSDCILQAVPALLIDMDVYSSQLIFQLLTCASQETLDDIFRYVPDQVQRVEIPALTFVVPRGSASDNANDEEFISRTLAMLRDGELERAAHSLHTMLELSASDLWSSSVLRWVLAMIEFAPHNTPAQCALLEALLTHENPDLTLLAHTAPAPVVTALTAELASVEEAITPENVAALDDTSAPTASVAPSNTDALMPCFYTVLHAQKTVLTAPASAWLKGRLKSVASTLIAVHRAMNKLDEIAHIQNALDAALANNAPEPLLTWLEQTLAHQASREEVSDQAKPVSVLSDQVSVEDITPDAPALQHAQVALESSVEPAKSVQRPEESTPHFGRRADDVAVSTSKTLKVDQEKIDRLMNLIGEMVVAKNALPYLANRAETVFGVRDLSREIKAQYAVINRVAEEMQDTIMQVRMMPVSFIFQRFPRMVRDISRKLGKEVELVLEGESTEADKNIIEALSDPLIHIVRNSLDHGLETPQERMAAGKNAAGKLLIRATQESDRVVIEIIDDGRGINPYIIKQKAYEKGLIDESVLERISDEEAVNLVFAAGFSTAEVISDLSGRGVGMDVVRSAVERINGTVGIQSEVGKGTRLFLSLPLSMAVTNVMIIESNQQIFGVSMDMVVETVRVPRAQMSSIKQKQTTVLRGRIVPLLSLNDLLALPFAQQPNEDDEFATLVVRVHGEHVGIIVDDFRETVDIILKPMTGILGGLGGFSGAALLGDGSVLMVLNPRELI
ncbi:MAG TPA: chemotaxis protein CheA [Methylococcaceae bacterium]|nr:chemotaxis protein CheA [Methylococcaceae bacterium]